MVPEALVNKNNQTRTKSSLPIPVASPSQTVPNSFLNTSIPSTLLSEKPSKRARKNSSVSSASFSSNLNEISEQAHNFSDSKLTSYSRSSKSKDGFLWYDYVEKTSSQAAPVYLFKHVPLANFWHKILKNIIVEVPNRDPPPGDIIQNLNKQFPKPRTYFWFALAIQYVGYYVKLRYIGYEDDSKYDFWMHMCDSNVHPVGWSAENSVILVPPYNIVDTKEDWNDYIMTKLVGYKTLPNSFSKKVSFKF